MKPYVIISPDYDYTSGGIKVMWSLYGWLLSKGVEVYINRLPRNRENITIYPEIQNGNPTGSSNVVRYILNTPGVMGGYVNGSFIAGPTTFPSTDKIYVFSRLFDTFGVSDEHILFLPSIDLHTFYDKKKERTRTCYFVGKGENKHLHPNDAIEVDRSIAQDQGLLSDILNTCHTMYCYDPISAMMEVSRLCGCKVRYVAGRPLEVLKDYEPSLNGIDSDLDIRAFTNHYIDLKRIFNKKLDMFIEETQS